MIMKNWLIKALFNLYTYKKINLFSITGVGAGRGGMKEEERRGEKERGRRGKGREDRQK